MVKAEVKASAILSVATQALLEVMEASNIRLHTSKEDRDKLNAAFSSRVSSVIKTVAALQHVGTLSGQIATDDGGVSDVTDYRGPANLMKLASVKRIYSTNVAILRAQPMLQVEWDVDIDGHIMSSREFNTIWDDFNGLQSSRKLALGSFQAEDLCISQLSAAYVDNTFVRLDGGYDAILTRLLGIAVPGDADSYYPAIVPSDEEVRVWLMSTGSLTKTEE